MSGVEWREQLCCERSLEGVEKDTTDRIASPVAGQECHQDGERRPSGPFQEEYWPAVQPAQEGVQICSVEDFFDATDLPGRAAKLAVRTFANCAKSLREMGVARATRGTQRLLRECTLLSRCAYARPGFLSRPLARLPNEAALLDHLVDAIIATRLLAHASTAVSRARMRTLDL